MSWTESYPIMDDAMVDEFEQLATPEERAELDLLYGVKEVFNRQDDKRHLLAMSLFWKPSNVAKPAYPTPTKEILQDPSSYGLELRFEPWPHYILPVLEGAPLILEQYDDVAIRVYLAGDLDFLVEDLVAAGCEVYLMQHPSIAHAPGVAWRVLAFEEKDRLVTMIDSDRLKEAGPDIERTRTMEQAGLGTWRVPVMIDLSPAGEVVYKPFIGCQIGSQVSWPVKQLIQAFTWHSQRGSIPYVVDVPGCGPRPINHGRWPDFGFEEWFLGVAMYPRMATEGLLTFVPGNAKSSILTLDVEYATWSNPNSQLVYFPYEGCCDVLVNEFHGGNHVEAPTEPFMSVV